MVSMPSSASWFTDSPGRIQSQVGMCLNSIREAIERRDAELEADHVLYLIALSAPKTPKSQRDSLRAKIPQRPAGRDRDGDFERRLHLACMEIVEELTWLLSEEGIYARGNVPVDDATELRLKDDGEESSTMERTPS